MEKKFGFFSSSVDPQSFSKFWANITPFILIAVAWLKLDISESEIAQLGLAIAGIYFGAQTVWGLIRKFQKHEPQPPAA